jgi:hypothetical protein
MIRATRLRTKLQLLLQVESSGFALALSILFVLLSLALPFWSFSRTQGPSPTHVVGSFSWVSYTQENYVGGRWIITTIEPFSETNFLYPAVAGVASNVYVLNIVYLLVLVAVLALFRFEFSRKMPAVNLLILSLVVLGVALFALFYPVVATPAAATTDIASFTVPGFWGSAQPSAGVSWSWGPGLGWWLFLVSVILGVGGTVLPYLKSLRSMAPTPQPTRPSS